MNKLLRATITLGIFFVLIVGGIIVVDHAYTNAPEKRSLQTEEFTVALDSNISLSKDKLVNESEIIYNSSKAVMTRCIDYRMNYVEGEVRPLSGGDLNSDKNATIKYEYKVGHSKVQEASFKFFSYVAKLGPVLGLLLAVTVMILGIYWFARSATGRSGGRR